MQTQIDGLRGRGWLLAVTTAAGLMLALAGCGGSKGKGTGGSGGGSLGGSAGSNTTGVGGGNGGGSGSGGSPAGAGGTAVACGASGQPCCAGNACDSGGCCIPGVPDAGPGQRTCIGAGQACVGNGVSGTCAAGSCTNTSGAPCGALDQVCCGGNAASDAGATGDGGPGGPPDGGFGGGGQSFCTASGTRCSGGMCGACGSAGQACCQGNGQCGASLECLAGDAGGSQCTACGAVGQPCCNGNGCNTGLGCDRAGGFGSTGTCENCG